jgi:hypothetical protein
MPSHPNIMRLGIPLMRCVANGSLYGGDGITSAVAHATVTGIGFFQRAFR